MGSLYRSEPMALCQLFLQDNSAFESVAELGELGVCQFRDLNVGLSAFQRKYVNEVKRTNEMERKINVIQNELIEQKVPIPDLNEVPPVPLYKDINELEANLERFEEEILKMKGTFGQMEADYRKLSDMRHVLLQIHVLLQEDQRSNAFLSITDAESGFGPIELTAAHASFLQVSTKSHRANSIMPIIPIPRPNELRFLAGIIPSRRVPTFERCIWRMCHGKVFLRAQNVEADQYSPFPELEPKSAFILFFSGDSLMPKVRKICNAFEATIVDNCPEGSRERADMLKATLMRLMELNTVVGKTIEHQGRMLNAAAMKVKEWEIQVLKLKSIFHTLNMFNLDVTQKCLIAECWIPQTDIPNVRSALKTATDLSGSSIPSIVNRLEGNEEAASCPPTFHRVNKFTSAFQNIVDAYGIANYREINPAPWTIITFPFLFAVMFGDSGHGLLMFLFALALILKERRIDSMKNRGEIFDTFYGGRYVILLMGIFAIYTGAIYNDAFSKSFNVFGSRWRWTPNMTAVKEAWAQNLTEMPMMMDPLDSFHPEQGPYVFGLDPVWNLALNKLNYVNPMKMKGSVILGITQMLFGVVLSLFNHIHFESKVDIFFVFIPQVLFLSLIFVYLCVQIILKWVFFTAQGGMVLGQQYPGSPCAPSLLVGLINMFMFKERKQGFYENIEKDEVWKQCSLQLWYPHQDYVEATFMTIAVLCIPVMLLVKPIYLWFLARKGRLPVGHGGHGGEHEEFNLGDVFVYQAIHTIEFALGCISHTASYLRLWALSLAHAQLSDVLWEMIMEQAFSLENNTLTGNIIAAIGMFVIFFAFGILSVAILVLMEGLSAFLHALRLHWVEFQSKFYTGVGIPFEPFSFKSAIRKKQEGVPTE